MGGAGFFLETGGGRRFCMLDEAAADPAPRGAILHVHAFGEEMNKSRPTVARAARALAANGWTVLRMDLLGCGDSEGDFGDATWAAWQADVAAGLDWLEGRFAGPAGLWGMRAGCLLATAAARGRGGPLLLWQPVLSGRQYLNQFLRLKVAGEMLAEAAQRSTTAALRERLLGGEGLEVAGYALAADLARGLDAAELVPPAVVRGDAGALPPRAGLAGRAGPGDPDAPSSVVWLEVATREDPELLPGSQARIAQWREAGVPVTAAALSGPAFWQSVEIEHCPALVEETVQALRAVAA